MNYFEQELIFSTENSTKSLNRGLQEMKLPDFDSAEILGIKIRLGNQPLVYNLKDLIKKSGKQNSSSANERIENKDYYLIVHAISALRTKGRAKVEELHYFADAIDPNTLQTIDLIPKTRFKEVLKANLKLAGGLNLKGETFFDVPITLTESLISEFINIGASMRLQLSTSAEFIGSYSYSVQIPVVQSAGISSNSCSWILKPDENKTPLLGDQLLIQSIGVPVGCKSVSYKINGLIKADKGIFWKQQEKKTDDLIIEVKLN